MRVRPYRIACRLSQAPFSVAQEDLHGVLATDHNRYVVVAVSVPITKGPVVRKSPHRDLNGVTKSSIALAEQNRKRMGTQAADNEVGHAVLIEVGLGEDMRTAAYLVGACEGHLSLTLVQQDRHLRLGRLRYRQVRPTVPVKVSGRNGGRAVNALDLPPVGEASLTIPKIDRQACPTGVGGNQIDMAIAIKIGRLYPCWPLSYRVRVIGYDTSLAVAQQDGNLALCRGRDGHIQVAVIIEVGH